MSVWTFHLRPFLASVSSSMELACSFPGIVLLVQSTPRIHGGGGKGGDIRGPGGGPSCEDAHD